MAVYNNLAQNSPIAAVEFSPVSDGNFTFVYTDPSQKDTVKNWLTSKEIGQEIIAESKVNGNAVLVTQGDKSKDTLLRAFENHGDQLELKVAKKGFNPWKWRGMMSNIGQTLNLVSGYRKPGGLDVPKISFAALNFLASYVNAVFGGQKSEDENRLAYMKEHMNELLGKSLPDGQQVLDINDDRATLRHEPAAEKGYSAKFHEFMAENSVRVGEIGLRYLGSIALAFPVKNWGNAFKKLSAGEMKSAFALARNSDKTNFYTGVTYLTGKTIGLFAKVPDPYSTKPHTMTDTIREKVLFRASSAIESGAAATLAVGNFKKDSKTGKRDYIGGTAGAVLTSGLLIRLFAPYGTKELDREELRAHVTDTLAKMPPQQIPQLMADSAAAIREQTPNSPREYGEIYTGIMTDLYRYHHIAPGETDVAQAPGGPLASKPASRTSFREQEISHLKRLERMERAETYADMQR